MKIIYALLLLILLLIILFSSNLAPIKELRIRRSERVVDSYLHKYRVKNSYKYLLKLATLKMYDSLYIANIKTPVFEDSMRNAYLKKRIIDEIDNSLSYIYVFIDKRIDSLHEDSIVKKQLMLEKLYIIIKKYQTYDQVYQQTKYHNYRILTQLGEIYAQKLSDSTKLRTTSEILLKEYDDLSGGLFFKSILLYRVKNYKEALQLLVAAVSLDDPIFASIYTMPIANLAIAIKWQRKGYNEVALAKLESYLDEYPHDYWAVKIKKHSLIATKQIQYICYIID